MIPNPDSACSIVHTPTASVADTCGARLHAASPPEHQCDAYNPLPVFYLKLCTAVSLSKPVHPPLSHVIEEGVSISEQQRYLRSIELRLLTQSANPSLIPGGQYVKIFTA